MSRREELALGLAAVRRRIEDACRESGRDADEVTLIVVTKFFPADDVRLLAELGVRHVGENRHPEGRDKQAECAELPLTWHYIGGLQSNKAAAVASYADAIHSIDRLKLVTAVQRGAHERAGRVDCLIQVSLDRPEATGRAGADPGEVAALATAIEQQGALRLRGLMAVAPLGEDPAKAFARIASIRTELLARHPEAGWLSAGMSGDLETAVKAGATHVRIGSAVLGPRPANR